MHCTKMVCEFAACCYWSNKSSESLFFRYCFRTCKKVSPYAAVRINPGMNRRNPFVLCWCPPNCKIIAPRTRRTAPIMRRVIIFFMVSMIDLRSARVDSTGFHRQRTGSTGFRRDLSGKLPAKATVDLSEVRQKQFLFG